MSSEAFSLDQPLWSVSTSLSLSGLPDGSHEIATALQITATFSNTQTGEPSDPTDVTLLLQNPAGEIQTMVFPGNIVKVATGKYAFTFVPTVSGEWFYKWQGTGAVVATSPDAMISWSILRN